jgi:hypothetical protein
MHRGFIYAVVVLGVLLGCCQAHMTIWTPSMWGVESNPTTAWMAQPLQDYNYSNWVCTRIPFFSFLLLLTEGVLICNIVKDRI